MLIEHYILLSVTMYSVVPIEQQYISIHVDVKLGL